MYFLIKIHTYICIIIEEVNLLNHLIKLLNNYGLIFRKKTIYSINSIIWSKRKVCIYKYSHQIWQLIRGNGFSRSHNFAPELFRGTIRASYSDIRTYRGILRHQLMTTIASIALTDRNRPGCHKTRLTKWDTWRSAWRPPRVTDIVYIVWIFQVKRENGIKWKPFDFISTVDNIYLFRESSFSRGNSFHEILYINSVI